MPEPQPSGQATSIGSDQGPSFLSHRKYFIGWYGLTAICALLDVVCFIGLGGVFASMMTGNLLLLAVSVGNGADTTTLLRQFAPIVFFSVGAILGGRLIRLSKPANERRVCFVVEWAVLVIATLIAMVYQPGVGNWAGQSIVALLGLAMGIHGATVRPFGISDLATNVMTTTLANWMSDTRMASGSHQHSARRGISILVFLCSGVLGALLWKWGGLLAPLVAATLLMTALLYPLLKGSPPAD